MNKIDLNKYQEFVEAVTSKESNDLTTFMNRLDRVDGNYEDYGPNGERSEEHTSELQSHVRSRMPSSA